MDSDNISMKENNESKNRGDLDNLKSIFMFKKIFNNLHKNKLLLISKYNKRIQNKLNLSIKDYKEYCEIEIEITPKKNKYGQFINYQNDKNKKKFYHIYFNDNKEEVTRNVINENEKIEKIKIILDYQINSFEGLFEFCNCIESISFIKFYRNNIKNMSNLFSNSSVSKINFYNFVTEKVTDMNNMFRNCNFLEELNLSNFSTNNVIDMSDMFRDCSSIKELDLSYFNTNKVTNMSGMFSGCKSLSKINLSNFNTNEVTNMSGMFSWCSSLKELDLSSFNTRKVTSMSYLFNECLILEKLNISNFNMSSVKNMLYMLSRCSNEVVSIFKSKFEKIPDEAFY